MKKIWIILLLSCVSITAFAQNLVPNPSFEDTVACPAYANQVDRAVGWHPSRGSPDYFNECDWITGTQHVPNNFVGYQNAHTGVAYCGAILFYRPAPNYRELFTCQLLSPLIIGKKYNLSFFVSVADYYFRLNCNKLGMLFSTNDFSFTNPAPINNYCQFHTDSIIIDTLNWTVVEGSFVADSIYTHLTIGAFFVDSLTDTIYNTPASLAYYYIDDISVIEDTITYLSNLTNNREVLIYPNPAHEYLTIKTTNRIITKCEIISIEGQLLWQFINNSESNQINLSVVSLKPAIYYLKLFYKNQNSTYHKLLKP